MENERNKKREPEYIKALREKRIQELYELFARAEPLSEEERREHDLFTLKGAIILREIAVINNQPKGVVSWAELVLKIETSMMARERWQDEKAQREEKIYRHVITIVEDDEDHCQF